jgi:anti-sigma factor ChrR (cupin superfamily)
MANTRNHNNNENNNAENSNAANPSSPSSPTLEQVLVMQAQMVQKMKQTMVYMQNAQSQSPLPPPRDKIGDF